MTQQNFPRVTIVTVVLNLLQNNREDMFRRCVQSIRQQTYPHIEHIVIDGASTDGTVELLQSMGLTFFSEKDTGIYDAMNKGILKATGQYIAFMNSDDYYASPTAVASMVQKMVETNADGAYGRAYIVGRPGKKDLLKSYWIGQAFYRMPVCHQAFFCTVASLKEQGLFDTSFRIAGDYNSIYKMVMNGKLIVPVQEKIACFVLGGISTQLIQKSKDESIRVIENNLNIPLSVAQTIAQNKYVPFRLYRQLRKRLHPKMVLAFDYVFLKQLLYRFIHSVATIHLRKGSRYIQLFGIRIIGQNNPTTRIEKE